MSNARSPREVCSTTIGISGLMVLALFRLPGLIPPGKCKAAPPPEASLPRAPWRPGGWVSAAFGGRARGPAGARGASGPGGPELLAGGGALRGDRDGGLDQAVERLALGDVLAQALEAARLAQLREQLVGVRSLPALVG